MNEHLNEIKDMVNDAQRANEDAHFEIAADILDTLLVESHIDWLVKQAKLTGKYRAALEKYATTSFGDTARQALAEDDQVTWISADYGEQQEQTDQAADDDYLPLFQEGETVITINPYTLEFEIVDFDGVTPLYYQIMAVEYTESKGYVYKLEHENGWFLEEWLEYPPFGMMQVDDKAIEYAEEDVKMTNEAESYMNESERNLLGKALDDKAKQQQIDWLLDLINEGTPAEAEEAKAVLRDLTEGAAE